MIRTLVLPLVLVAGSAFAAPPEDGTQGGDATATTEPAAKPTTPPAATEPAKVQMFSELDLNKDGALDRTEITKIERLNDQFATVDTDKNGKLSKGEYEAWTAKLAEHKP